MKGLSMVRKRSGISILKFVVLCSVSAAGLLACAGKNHNSFKESSIRGFKSSRELHLKQQAWAASSDALKTLPDMTPQEHERLGDIYFRRGDLAMAFAQYSKALLNGPEHADLFYKKGLLLVLGKMNEDAVPEFEKALEKDPKNAQAYEGLGLAYFQMQKYEQAKSSFQNAIQLDPKLWKAHNFLGIIYDYQGDHKKAAIEYEASIASTDKTALLYNNLGISFFLAGDYENAVNAFRRAVSLGQGDQRTYNNLGLALSTQAKYGEALEAFRKGGDEAQAYNNLGCIYLKHGKYEKAERCFEKAIELKPTFYAKASENARKARMDHGLSFDLTVETSLEGDIPTNKIIIKKRTWQKPDTLKSDNKVEENALMPLIAEEVDAKPVKKKEASPRQPEASSTNTAIGKITPSTPLPITSSGSSE